MFRVDALLRSPLGRLLGRWLESGPPGLELHLDVAPEPGEGSARPQQAVIEVRNRGWKPATLTELGLLDHRGEPQPLDSPELVLKPGAVLRLRVDLRSRTTGTIDAATGIRVYAVDSERRQFLSA